MKEIPDYNPGKRIDLLRGKARSIIGVLMIIVALMAPINVIATGILFLLTVNDNEPFIAPMSEVSMTLRWIVIAAVIAFFQSLFMLGCLRGAQKSERRDRNNESAEGEI